MDEPNPRRWWALGGLTLAVLAVGLDATVLSVALPTLARKLHASESDLQWFSSGYLLVLAAAMLPFGLLGGRYHGGGDVRVVAAGPDPRRLAVDPLLVGVGVPDQRARLAGWRGRHLRV